MELGVLRSKAPRHAQVYNVLRQRSRAIAVLEGLTGCEICGYDKHVEIAHIIALSKLPDTATVEEASGRINFRILCPNCHWEFDNL
jgi:5-methylcytosine-specific restriction endonuclease McrA